MKMSKLVGLVTCLAAILSAGAETVIVDASNSPFMIGGTGYDPRNAASCVYDLREGAVMCMTNSLGAQRLWCNVVATNGAAIFRRGEKSGNLDVRGSLIVKDAGSLTVEGYTQVIVDVDISGGGHFGDLVCDIPNLDFAAAGTLTLSGGALKSLPSGANYTVAWTEGGDFAIPAGSEWSDQDVFTFPNETVNFYIAETNSLKAGCRVIVPAGRTFGVAPAYQPGTSNPYKYRWDDRGNTFVTDCTVELAEGSTFDLRGLTPITCSGSVAGAGGVSVSPVKTLTTTPEVSFRLVGECSFTGPVTMSAPSAHLYLGGATQPIRSYVMTGTAEHLHFLSPEEGGPANVTLGSVNGKYWGDYVHATAGQHVTVQRAQNQMTAWPDTTTDGACVDFDPGVGPASIRFYGGSTNVCVKGVSVQVGNSDGIVSKTFDYALCLPGEDGRVDWSKHEPGVSAPWYRLAGHQVVSNAPSARPIRVASSGGLALSTRLGETPANVMLEVGSTLDLSVDTAYWKKTAALWLDPNSSRVYLPGDLIPPAWSNLVLSAGGTVPKMTRYSGVKPYIEGMADCRGAGYEYYMAFNDRSYDNLGQATPSIEDLPSVKALLDTRSDGLKFINCASGRLPVHRGGPTNLVYRNAGNREAILNPTLVIMVFGSAKGGGSAIIGTSTGAFARTAGSAENPIVNASLGDRKVWVDGVEVDPTTTGLNGGWQIISAELTDLTVDGFGWQARRTNSSGQQYGEILVFTNEVNDVTRQLIEAELARRWGVTTYADATFETSASLSGSGQVTISSEKPMTVSGHFCGTATLAGGTTVVVPAALPWSESEVEATEPATWIDPSLRSTVSTLTDLGDSDKSRRPTEIRAIWDRRYGVKAVGSHYLYGIMFRTPAYAPSARGLGPEQGWIDYNNLYEVTKNDASNGNTMRFREWTSSTKTIGEGDNAPVGAKTVFIAQDSCRGGSTPVMDDVSGSSGSAMPLRKNSQWSGMMSTGAKSDILNGDVRLNGETVASPTETYFTGCPEIFSFSTANDYSFPATFFAYYGDSETYATQSGTIQGEILLYDKYLDPEVRTNVEQYLLSKWVGYLPAGRTDWRMATIDGVGTVKAASFAVAPQLAATFAGTLEVGGTAALAVTATIARDGSVTGGYVHPETTLTLADDSEQPTLEVVVEKHAAGTFTLVNLKAISPAKTWRVNVRMASGEACANAEVVTSRDGAEVTVTIRKPGFMVLVH